jgi:hypothetical protein
MPIPRCAFKWTKDARRQGTCTAGRLKAYAARRAAGVPAIQRKPKRLSAPSPPKAKIDAAGPKVVLTEEDVKFGRLTGMLKP